jgi:SAM-dependent methyltransferase
MLRRARARLAKGHKSPREHITLVQGDLTALPFKPRAFTTVNCWGVLHLFDDPVAVVEELERVVASAGRLFCTSLVTGRALGSWYQRILADRGISARPMDSGDLTARLRAAGFAPECYVRGSMAYLSVPRRMSEA